VLFRSGYATATFSPGFTVRFVSNGNQPGDTAGAEQMINSGETDTSAITDLLGSLTSDNLLESASDLLGEGTFAYESQTEITINQTTNASYIENAYADDSTNDTTEQFNNVDVLI